MIRLFLIILSALTLTACDPLSRIEGKSPSQDYIKRLEEMERIMEPIMAERRASEASHQTAEHIIPKQCVPVFRISTCVDGLEVML